MRGAARKGGPYRDKAGPDTAASKGVGERERAQAGGTREALSTVAGLAFGPAHSSDKAPVMGVERRSRTVLV